MIDDQLILNEFSSISDVILDCLFNEYLIGGEINSDTDDRNVDGVRVVLLCLRRRLVFQSLK